MQKLEITVEEQYLETVLLLLTTLKDDIIKSIKLNDKELDSDYLAKLSNFIKTKNHTNRN
jgi:hypothetical protein